MGVFQINKSQIIAVPYTVNVYATPADATPHVYLAYFQTLPKDVALVLENIFGYHLYFSISTSALFFLP